jgi:Uma2 family endonuclease
MLPGMTQPARADTAPSASMSLEQWAAMDEDEPGELVDGRLVEEEVPDYVHEVVVSWLNAVLRVWAVARGGFVAGSDAKFAVSLRRGRKPDLSVYLPGGRVPPRRGVIRVPPDIAVEVLSPAPRDGRRDRIEKHAEYAAFGVRFYWIVDPELRTIEIFERGADGRYVSACRAADGKVEEVPGCDGLALDLDDLWAEIDRLGPDEAESGSEG